jgi:hypothetical protein
VKARVTSRPWTFVGALVAPSGFNLQAQTTMVIEQ